MTSNTPEADKDCWRTPPWLFDFLFKRFGFFDVDLAASDDNKLCLKYFDVEANSLTRRWYSIGQRGFLNPPYSNPLPWIEKAIEEAKGGFSTTMVLPTHSGEKWAALSRHATERIEFEGRIKFNRPDGTPGPSPRNGAQVLYFRADDLGNTRLTWVSTKALIAKYNSRPGATS